MSAIQFIVKSIQDMSQADREAVFAAFAMDPPVAAAVAKPATAAASKAAKAEKKPRANAGKPSCHGAWTKHVLDRFSKDSVEQKEFLAARIASAERGEMLYTKDMSKVKTGKKQVGDAMDAKDAAVGAHMAFVGWWSEQHQAEHAEFKAAWELEHPKGASGTVVTAAENSDDAATVADEDDTAAPSAAVGGAGSAAAAAPVAKPEAKKRGPKKMADMTPEELAAAKAKRAENKAKKASANNSAEGSRASSPPKVKDE
jgi:hypothetical protein